ncbi:hypothetical protein LINGRAHAP2_LOCUS7119 [Linum grandiflorum]
MYVITSQTVNRELLERPTSSNNTKSKLRRMATAAHLEARIQPHKTLQLTSTSATYPSAYFAKYKAL